MTRNTSKLLGYLKLSAGALLLTGAMSACSDIDEADRFEYVKPADAARKVLIEDFTGQRCVNCPNATDEIHFMQEQFGEDNVIAVGIHSGPLGFKGTAKQVGLLTDLGNTYYYHWGLDHQPVGLVNREAPSDYPSWAGQVMRLITQKAPLSLAIRNAYDASTRTVSITVDAEGTNGTTTGKLQVWLVEDGITAMQMMPDGSNNREYVHNHVLRDAVNGEWGTDFTVHEADNTTQTFTYQLNEKWVAENVSVVAFVYNDNGVAQVEKAKVVETIIEGGEASPEE